MSCPASSLTLSGRASLPSRSQANVSRRIHSWGYIVAREAIGRGHEHAVNLVPLHGIAQAIKPRARQNGAAVPLVPEDVGRVEDPALSGMHLHVRRKPVELLLNRLMLDLMAGRDTAVDRDPHGAPPAG